MAYGYFYLVLAVWVLSITHTEGVCNIPNFIEIKEDATGNILNNSITLDVPFTWDITEVSGHPINSLSFENQQKINGYFSWGRNNASVWINVVKAIDKESLVVVIGIIVSNIKLRVTCDKALTDMTVVIRSVNEFPPEFGSNVYYINVSENTAAGTSVYTINDVTDRDVDESNDRIYTVSRDLQEFDGTPYFGMEAGSIPNIVLLQPIDYDAIVEAGKVPTYLIKVTVADHGGRTDNARFNFTIINEDDQPPAFIPSCGISCTPSYTAIVPLGHRGPLTNVTPAALQAADLDKQHTVRYSLVQDSEEYYRGFSIDADTGVLTALSAVLRTAVLQIKVTENSSLQRSAVATMLVKISTNTTVVEPPRVGQSVLKEEDDNMLIIVIVVGIISLLVIVALIIALTVYCKRQRKKTIKPGDVGSSPSGSQDALNADKELSSSKQELLQSYAMFMTSPDGKNDQLPPISKVDMMIGTDEFKKRSRKRKKKELEVFDGTREYDMEADINFFKQGTKSKIKRSTRSIKEQKLDPKYWITVQNGYLE
ncbi:uncharacterized protein LOC133176167 [Saccostrea echinata]|uniref:uncharacterized protein LOC133176167 n=1 Tax=Saccostrea echinata TaxID=191078 RepID=UPI002A82C66E|nr:uncharacterized protein LOC133176167 [Saccostrea echinata]